MNDPNSAPPLPPPPVPGPSAFGQVVPQYLPPKKSNTGKWVAWGCGGCLTLLIIAGVIIYFIFQNVMGIIKKSPAYVASVELAQKSPEVIEALGEPIEPEGMPQGSINMTNDSGTAELTIPLKGPKGTGEIAVKATKAPGKEWEVQSVTFSSGGKKVDLGTDLGKLPRVEKEPEPAPEKNTPPPNE